MMNGTKTLLGGLVAAVLLSSCASAGSKTEGTLIGGGIGCAGGAILAAVTKNDVATGCAAGAVIGGLIGYMNAREAEVADAQKAADSASRVAGAKVSPVQTQTVQVTDKKTKKTDTVKAFKSVSVDIPKSQLDTAEGKDAVRKLEEYARKTAADRGETVDVTYVARPEKSGGTAKVTLKQSLEASGGGQIRRNYVADPRLPANVQRITIEVKNKDKIEV